MKPAIALLLLGAALLLVSVGNCSICPAVKKDVDIFIKGTLQNYVEYVAKFKSNPLLLANAKKLKTCVDEKLTEEDKQQALNGLDKVYESKLC